MWSTTPRSRRSRRALAAAALATMAPCVPAAGAQAQVLTVTPFCDSTTVGAPASGFNIVVRPAGGVTLSIMDANGLFNPQPFRPVEEFRVAASFPPGIGATTFELYADPNLNGARDPGEALLERIVQPDPCAPSRPTAKEQCKDGGWRTFGDAFRNQGQCVAFVQRGPKP